MTQLISQTHCGIPPPAARAAIISVSAAQAALHLVVTAPVAFIGVVAPLSLHEGRRFRALRSKMRNEAFEMKRGILI